MVVSELFAKLGLAVDEAGFAKGEAAIGGLKGALVGVGISAAAIRAGVEALINETANAISATNKGAQRAQIAREAWAELAHAADENGIAAEGMGDALKFLNKAAADASGGSQDATAAFRKLGISVKDGSGHAKDADALFTEIVENWKRLPEGPEKAALAMKLFGRSGTEMIPMLNKGGAALKEYREEAHKLGLVFSDEDFEAAKKYKKSLNDLGDEVEAVKLAIGKSLLKEAGGAARAMAEWLEANREWIVAKVHDAIDLLSKAWKVAKGVLDPFIAAIAWLVSQTWLLKAATVALGIALAVSFGNSARSAWREGIRLLGMLRGITAAQVVGAASAIGWGLAWAAGIALALGAIEELYGWITGDRDTLLEEWLGSFADVKKSIVGWMDESDSPFAKMVKGIAESFERARSAVTEIKAALGLGTSEAWLRGKIDQGAMSKGFEVVGATGMYSQRELSKDPRFTELSRAGDWETLRREFTGKAAEFAARGPGGGGAISVTVPVTVQAPPGTVDPEAFGTVAGRAAAAAVRDELRGIFDAAHEAVGY